MSVDDARRARSVSARSSAARAVLLAAVLLATATLTACGSVVIAGTATAAATSAATDAVEVPTETPATDAVDATTWMDGVCGSLVRLTNSTGRKPAVDSSSPKAVTSSVVRYLNGLERAVDTATSELEADHPAPFTAGDSFLVTLTDSLSDARAALEQTKTNLEKSTPRSEKALEKALEPLTSFDGRLDPMDDLDGGAEIESAAADAPNCQELDRLVSAGDGFALQGI